MSMTTGSIPSSHREGFYKINDLRNARGLGMLVAILPWGSWCRREMVVVVCPPLPSAPLSQSERGVSLSQPPGTTLRRGRLSSFASWHSSLGRRPPLYHHVWPRYSPRVGHCRYRSGVHRVCCFVGGIWSWSASGLVTAAIRCIVQLASMGLVLQKIFDVNDLNPWGSGRIVA